LKDLLVMLHFSFKHPTIKFAKSPNFYPANQLRVEMKLKKAIKGLWSRGVGNISQFAPITTAMVFYRLVLFTFFSQPLGKMDAKTAGY